MSKAPVDVSCQTSELSFMTVATSLGTCDICCTSKAAKCRRYELLGIVVYTLLFCDDCYDKLILAQSKPIGGSGRKPKPKPAH